jgi:peptidyl-dipeptidase A
MRVRYLAMLMLALLALVGGCLEEEKEEVQTTETLDSFLADYNEMYRELWQLAEGARWDANTNINDETSELRIIAEKKFAQILGSADLIEKAQAYLETPDLDFSRRKQLQYVLLNAAKFPGTIPETTELLIQAEAEQNALLYSYDFKVKKPDGRVEPTSSNAITEVLAESFDLDERLAYWEASKAIGPVLKQNLVHLRNLRNNASGSMGHPSFFAMEVSEYNMTSAEMMTLMDEILVGIKPLYEQLHCWVRHTLADRYDQPVPKLIPAHWLGNKWGQAWPGIIEDIDLDALLEGKTDRWMLEQAEQYYVSMGFPRLPAGFWEASDLYELPGDSDRRKNTHASAWHIDLDQDVRCLMSVTPTFDWLQTTHHELGHIYYYLSYSNPHVPFVLRTGSNRAFHEGVGTLIELVSSQTAYLREIGLLQPSVEVDEIQWLLSQALLGPVTFLPFACGTMTHWEHDFYEEPLFANQMNSRWWQYAAQYQGIAPPSERGEDFCDPATKTHISDDPAQYYDYALSSVILHQFHDYICREILHEAPQTATYYNKPEVGAYLQLILRPGATRDWRELMRESTGEDLSSRAMLEYFEPLRLWLVDQNQGRDVAFD